MHLIRGYAKNWTRLLGVPPILGAAIALAGCAAPSSYMGIDLTTPPSAATASQNPSITTATGLAALPLPDLGRMAQGGNKHAQLELGIRFEEGRGVERDLGMAKKLYRLAASDSGGRIWVYSPPVGNGTKGQVIPVGMGPRRFGLVVAQERLKRVE